MIMRSAIIIPFFLFAAATASLAQTEATSKEDALMLSLSTASFDEMLSTIRALSPAEKANLIGAVRENRSGIWGKEIDPTYLNILLYLGDPIERKRAVAEFRLIRRNNPELVKLGEPWVIEELASELFLKEEITEQEGDIPNPPISYAVASLIIANLQHATIYRGEVLKWAKQTNPYDQPALRSVMRDWWRENERFFKEKNYQAVKPGRPLALPAPVQSEPPNNSLPAQPGTLPPASAPSPSPQPSSTNHWPPPGVIACLLALLGAGIFWLQSKRRKQS